MSSSDSVYAIVYLISNLITSLLSIATMVLAIVGLWKIFTKAGEEGWKAIIPYYNLYVLCKIVGGKFLRLIISLVLFIMSTGIMVMMSTIGIAMAAIYNSTSGLIVAIIITIICTLIMLAFLIWYCIEHALICGALSRSFGHGTGFAVGLFFMAPIFYMILGFNQDKYIGPNGVNN